MYSKVSESTGGRLTVASFTGGVNLRDDPSLVRNDQLTECRNLYASGGLLVTRPGLACSDTGWYALPSEEHRVRLGDVRLSENGHTYFSRVVFNHSDLLPMGEGRTRLYFSWVREDGEEEIAAGDTDLYCDDVHDCTMFLCPCRSWAYCFLRYFRAGQTAPDYVVYEIGLHYLWLIGEEGFYSPLILTNGQPSVTEHWQGVRGTMAEGYNLIAPHARAVYSTYDATAEAAYAPGTKNTYARYPLPLALTSAQAGEFVTAKYVDAQGNEYTHSVVLRASGETVAGTETTPGSDGLLMEVTARMVRLLNAGGTAQFEPEDYVQNNLTVTFPVRRKQANMDKIFCMTCASWYGGAAYGLSGGSRLFLSGNTVNSERALVVWSDLNEPLYFSENNYAYVGDKGQAVTALGRQEDKLVIFKEHEIFMTVYNQGNAVTAKELMEQSKIDLATQMAYFPMLQLHGGIGCDCPGTVQLCGNRLVWCCRNGTVYTLLSLNGQNGHAVLKLSGTLGDKLKEYDLSRALSAETDGRYLLLTGETVFVMDHRSFAFENLASYGREDNAPVPWFCWTLPIVPRAVTATDETLLLATVAEKEGWVLSDLYHTKPVGTDAVRFLVSPGAEAEEEAQTVIREETIRVSARTALFSLGRTDRTKRVRKVHVTVGGDTSAPFYVTVSGGKKAREFLLFLPEKEAMETRLLRVTGSPAPGAQLSFSGKGRVRVAGATVHFVNGGDVL